MLCAAVAALGYLVVYRQERAVDAGARRRSPTQGPRIVEQMLSYDADTLQDDFARAQSLATDSYRPQLIAQQEAVQKAGVTSNEYWAVSSAVLTSAAPDRASMLLAMQGQRGTDPGPAASSPRRCGWTSTSRADGQWRVANLTRAEEAADESGRAQ